MASTPATTVSQRDAGATVAGIAEARGGCRDAIGRAVEACRQYLLLIADRELDSSPALRARGGASDLVQETMLVAQTRFDRFTGDTEAELRAWTRRILLHRLAQFRRRHSGTGKRSIGREVPLELHEHSADRAHALTSASGQVVRGEQLRALQQSIEALPERYRRVFLWRHQEGCSHEEIGHRLGISSDAARKLWARAIERLQADLESVL
jgi:RNA polymerase sigma-70 factor (ECF subfamily)